MVTSVSVKIQKIINCLTKHKLPTSLVDLDFGEEAFGS